MNISNDDLARILGRMEAKLDEQAGASKRVEAGLSNLDTKVTARLDHHDQRIRDLEVANPKKLAETLSVHALRLEALEKGAARIGVVSGVGSALAISVIIEVLKKKIGL
ncbi:MAG: hypothetical protein M3Y65_19055 [Pseudomonadota bacterium]|nr:hypothetical protein [Pseudomonadota bacterium]